ncbi:hypothetical protein KWF55_19555 [Acinetobacter pittii]|nr:hypothetical protein [Acinetobacter pittii]MCE6001561.1 hypothetical protein [Acinetobacter pittii]MCE6629952.1 hypothetical protein [Acinetobacter pittii]MDP7845370.1 hypothetical protein [Acinetobacter pittii]MDP7872314.1 hypothetical protein [Acinetobacter pittii]UFN55404.1 hypothetical protein LPS07_12155 [Acinetobacter pittii]
MVCSSNKNQANHTSYYLNYFYIQTDDLKTIENLFPLVRLI